MTSSPVENGKRNPPCPKCGQPMTRFLRDIHCITCSTLAAIDGTEAQPDVVPDIKPCPFCGAQPLVNHIEAHTHSDVLKRIGVPDHPGSVVIECGCGAGLIDDTLEQVRERWNRRASPFRLLRWASR